MSDSLPSALALDIGGTALKAGLVASDGTLAATSRVATAVEDGPEAVAAQLERVLLELKETASAMKACIVAVGVAAPGVVDEDAGVVTFSANLSWRERPLARRLEQVLELPVVLCHDVRAAALAEARLGAAGGVEDFLFLALGTGVSAALVLGGTARSGHLGRAGEIGHVVVEENGEHCGCGARGCLETVASARAVQRRYRARGGAELEASEILRRAVDGDEVAGAVRDEAIDGLSLALAWTQALTDVELVVFGGGMGGAAELLIEPLEVALAERCRVLRPPRLVVSALGTDAGVLGAGLRSLAVLSQRPGPCSSSAPQGGRGTA